MSLATWKREFYPKTAKQAARGSALAAARHSLQKWTGLLAKNLRKHGVGRGRGGVRDTTNSFNFCDWFLFDANSCSLCQKFLDVDAPFLDDGTPCLALACATCPLAETLGGHSCAADDQPYDVFAETGDPNPMIRALRRTVSMLEAKSRKRA